MSCLLHSESLKTCVKNTLTLSLSLFGVNSVHSFLQSKYINEREDESPPPPALPAKTALHLPPPLPTSAQLSTSSSSSPPHSLITTATNHLTEKSSPSVHHNQHPLKRFSYHSNSNSPSSTLSSSHLHHSPYHSLLQHNHHHHSLHQYHHPPPPKPYLPPASQRLSAADLTVGSTRHPQRTPTLQSSAEETEDHRFPPHHHPMLQRSVTSSAILISPKKDGSKKQSTPSPSVSQQNLAANGHAIYQRLGGHGDKPNTAIHDAGDAAGISNGPTEPNLMNDFATETQTKDVATTPSSSSKFSMPGLFKKLRSGVTPAKYGQVQSKQSFVHPNRIASEGEESPGRRKNGIVTQAGEHDGKTDPGKVSEEEQRKSNKKRNGGTGKKSGYGINSYKKSSLALQCEESNYKSAPDGAENQCSVTNKSCHSNSTPSKDSPRLLNGKPTDTKKGASRSKSTKESSSQRGFATPTSPKPLVRALGRLKLLRGGAGHSSASSDDSNDSNHIGGSGGPSGSVVAKKSGYFNPLQKSASVGHSVFTSVVQDCGKNLRTVL